MAETTIFRPATEAEKKDFIELGTVTLLERFLEALSKKGVECQRQYIPFDRYSARIDFEEQIRKAFVDGSNNLQKTQVNIELPNLETYCDKSRFELISIEDVKEDKLLDGIRQSAITGKQFNFRAKPRGNGITIFVPKDDVMSVETKWVKQKEVKEAK